MVVNERTAENQRRFRVANERIDEARVELGFDGSAVPFLCECPDPRCTEVITLTPDAYRSVRDGSDRYLMRGDHVPDGEDVVEEFEEYVVTVKGGDG